MARPRRAGNACRIPHSHGGNQLPSKQAAHAVPRLPISSLNEVGGPGEKTVAVEASRGRWDGETGDRGSAASTTATTWHGRSSRHPIPGGDTDRQREGKGWIERASGSSFTLKEQSRLSFFLCRRQGVHEPSCQPSRCSARHGVVGCATHLDQSGKEEEEKRKISVNGRATGWLIP